MNEMYQFIDKVTDPAEQEAKNIYSLLDQELRQLKFKVSRCSIKCFQEKPLPQAFACEKACAESIQKVIKFLNTRQEHLNRSFQHCIDNVAGVLEGKAEQAEFRPDAGATKCVEEYRAGLEAFKKQATQEFSYFL